MKSPHVLCTHLRYCFYLAKIQVLFQTNPHSLRFYQIKEVSEGAEETSGCQRCWWAVCNCWERITRLQTPDRRRHESLTAGKPQGFSVCSHFAPHSVSLDLLRISSRCSAAILLSPSPHCTVSFGSFYHLSSPHVSLPVSVWLTSYVPQAGAHLAPSLRRPFTPLPPPPHTWLPSLFSSQFSPLSSYFILSNPFHGASCVNNRDRPSMFSQ